MTTVTKALRSRSMLALLIASAVIVVGALAWSVVGRDGPQATAPVLAASTAAAEDDPSNPVSSPATDPAATDPAPSHAAAVSPADASAPSPAAANPLDAQAAMLAAPLNTVTLARQKLKRGGLGSKVRGTFVVRNRNDFAIKDVEILCAFQGQGGYVTSRRHVLREVIEAKRRETFANVLVGHIVVTAPRGKCRLTGASRA